MPDDLRRNTYCCSFFGFIKKKKVQGDHNRLILKEKRGPGVCEEGSLSEREESEIEKEGSDIQQATWRWRSWSDEVKKGRTHKTVFFFKKKSSLADCILVG